MEVIKNISSAGGGAEQSNVAWISAEIRDKVVHPFHSTPLVPQAIITGAFVACKLIVLQELSTGCKPEKPYAKAIKYISTECLEYRK